jgi:hypothetical protein
MHVGMCVSPLPPEGVAPVTSTSRDYFETIFTLTIAFRLGEVSSHRILLYVTDLLLQSPRLRHTVIEKDVHAYVMNTNGGQYDD